MFNLFWVLLWDDDSHPNALWSLWTPHCQFKAIAIELGVRGGGMVWTLWCNNSTRGLFWRGLLLGNRKANYVATFYTLSTRPHYGPFMYHVDVHCTVCKQLWISCKTLTSSRLRRFCLYNKMLICCCMNKNWVVSQHGTTKICTTNNLFSTYTHIQYSTVEAAGTN